MLAAIFGILALIDSMALSLLALALALHLALVSALPQLNLAHYTLLFVTSLTLPVMGLAAGEILASFLEWKHSGLPILAAVLSVWSGFDMNLEYFFTGALLIKSGSFLKLSLFVTSWGTAVTACVGLITLTLMFLIMIPELAMRWFLGATQIKVKLPFNSMRMIAMVAAAALAFNLMLGLCAAELEPTIILRGFLK